MRVRVLVLALVCVASAACERDSNTSKSGASSDASPQSGLAALDAEAAARAVESVESGPPEAHPELALRALAKLERERLGASFSAGLEHLVEAPAESRREAAAPALAENLAMLDAACPVGEALLRELAQIEAQAQAAELVWSRCELERLGLLAAPAAARADPSVLLLVHMAHAKLAAAGELDVNERKLLELAVGFGSAEVSTELVPDPITHPCVVLAAKFDQLFESGDSSCETDADCSCSPGGISEEAGCGRVTSTAVATQLGEIYAEFRQAKCPLVRHCAPRACEAACVEGSCR